MSVGSNHCGIACGDFNLRVKEDEEERKDLGLQDPCGEIKDAFGNSLMIYRNFLVLSHLLLIYVCKLHWKWWMASGPSSRTRGQDSQQPNTTSL